MDLDKALDKYAKLIVHTGLNLQPGEKLQIGTNADGLELARRVSRAAYQAGVVDVKLMLKDDAMSLDRFLYAPDAAFETYPDYEVDYTEAMYKDGYQLLRMSAANPELLKTADPERIRKNQKTYDLATRRLDKYIMQNMNKWCVVGVAGAAWAKAVFPDLPVEEAMDRLWENIFKATRVDQDDPVAAWQAHNQMLRRRMDILNHAKFEKVCYEGPGTHLEVGLADGNRWEGGSATSQSGVAFLPNMPTEEIFGMPHADRVNGTVTATLPLSLRGKLIEGFWFKFKDGIVVDFDAKAGKEILQGLLDTDEGARRLGEIALVAHNSPISQTGLLFKNTLFDENASCHFALGQAYTETLEGAAARSEEENRALGMNASMIHTDFMVGSQFVTVTGVKADGTQVVLLKDGDWQI